MINQLFPKKLDNNYQGHAIAKWIFYLITMLSIVRSLIHMFAPDSGAQSIATIPLDTFTTNGAASVVLMLALWGSAQFLMALVYLIVIWRYRAFIPTMYLLLFIEYSLRIFLMHIKPIEITGTAPGHILDYVMVPLSLSLFYFSLHVPKRNPSRG